MLPMLEDQDRLFINKLAYRVGDIHRGDVVVFLYPHDHQKSYIKRVIALPGDDLRIDHGRVFVNGKRLSGEVCSAAIRRRPLFARNDRAGARILRDGRPPFDLERQPGLRPVDRELIYGKAAFVYWPMEQAGVVR